MQRKVANIRIILVGGLATSVEESERFSAHSHSYCSGSVLGKSISTPRFRDPASSRWGEFA